MKYEAKLYGLFHFLYSWLSFTTSTHHCSLNWCFSKSENQGRMVNQSSSVFMERRICYKPNLEYLCKNFTTCGTFTAPCGLNYTAKRSLGQIIQVTAKHSSESIRFPFFKISFCKDFLPLNCHKCGGWDVLLVASVRKVSPRGNWICVFISEKKNKAKNLDHFHPALCSTCYHLETGNNFHFLAKHPIFKFEVAFQTARTKNNFNIFLWY